MCALKNVHCSCGLGMEACSIGSRAGCVRTPHSTRWQGLLEVRKVSALARATRGECLPDMLPGSYILYSATVLVIAIPHSKRCCVNHYIMLV